MYWLSKFDELQLRKERVVVRLDEVGIVNSGSVTEGDVGGKLRFGLSIGLRPEVFLSFPK